MHGASVASAARRARVGSARAGPRPQRERAQRRASALHAQATSRSEGQGWHVGARAGAEGTAASRSCSALPRCVEQVSPARRGARASEAHVLGLVPRESERRDAQARYTRKPPRAVRGRAGTWEHGLAPKERRLLARAVPFHSAWSECRQRGAERARVGSARAGPRPQRERAQWRASALHAQATSRSEEQGWHVGARAGAEGTAASRSCSALPRGMEQVSPARRGAHARRKRTCWASSPERASAETRKRATRASQLAQ